PLGDRDVRFGSLADIESFSHECPLCGPKQTCSPPKPMSAQCHKQTSRAPLDLKAVLSREPQGACRFDALLPHGQRRKCPVNPSALARLRSCLCFRPWAAKCANNGAGAAI